MYESDADDTDVLKILLYRTLLTLALIVCSTASVHAEELKKVLFIRTMTLPLLVATTDAFEQRLNQLAGEKTIAMEYENAHGDYARALSIIERQVLHANNVLPDLVVCVATLATRAAMETKLHEKVPIIFLIVADPKSEGVISEFGQHSQFNITGESHVVDAAVKISTFDTLMKHNVGSPFNRNIALISSTYPSGMSSTQALLNATQDRAGFFVEIQTPFKDGDNGEQAMMSSLTQLLTPARQLSGYWMTSEPLSLRPAVHAMLKNEFGLVQVFAEDVASVKRGALMAIQSDLNAVGRNAAHKAYQILYNGKAANEFPVTRTQNFVLSFNLTTALNQQIVIPSGLLRLADNNVFR